MERMRYQHDEALSLEQDIFNSLLEKCVWKIWNMPPFNKNIAKILLIQAVLSRDLYV